MFDAPTPEFRLLLVCTLPPVDALDSGRLRQAVNACTDWAAFLKLVRRHQLMPLAACNLRRYAADSISPDLLTQLEALQLSHRQQTALLMLELGVIHRAFVSAGIRFCSLKGPWLSERLYGSSNMRSSGDLDLLVAPEAMEAADSALLAQGYVRTEPTIDLSPQQWQRYRQIVHHVAYKHPKRGIPIELHWALATPELIPPQVTQRFLSRANLAPGSKALVLNDEDLLCYLIVHGARHAWEELKWLADIAAFLRQSPGPDWAFVQEQMSSMGLPRLLGQALLLARDLFSAPIPPSLWPLLEDRAVQKLAKRALKIICSETGFGKQRGHFRRLRSLIYRMDFTPCWRYKLSAFRQLWIVDDDWQDVKLPDWLFPLYVFLRPFLWLRRYHLPHFRPGPVPGAGKERPKN
ncbi:MAG: nucleotidyltransferase domain-containing protein [Chloroflexota bacterium]